MVERKVGDWGWGVKGNFRSIRVLEIPHIGVCFHFVRCLLETRNSIGDSKFVRAIGMPRDLTHAPFAYVRWISE
jgi:hypothetical protein